MFSKAQIKYIQSLQHKKYRQKFGQFVAEGDKIVQELLQGSYGVKAVYATAAWLEAHGNVTGIEVLEVDAAILKQISSLSTPNQAVALVDIPALAPPVFSKNITLALEAIRDPGNMGTIIRIADWFGIRQIICSPDCVDAYNAKTIQATMGSIMRVPVIEMELTTLLKTPGQVPSYAATLHGHNIVHTKTLKEGIILIGNESRGLSEEILQLSSHQITIPRIGQAESLNAAVATGIICGRLLI
jgi:TrmH family RNA methyltransferase